ncbi:DUF262 domain-containing protein [Amorphus orientalis]|uniref:DUF262 domain-containing protein n=1 Tax=Amorphus orientalis TaxID=649198 RepID=A0AAE3VLK7_9HYPH|nr:DUF262 domain-containing HNH endonuclease family protein [Amorphus orientalis]MDQ0314754.1 hypothetical protein [Amorphus orientalis]
MQDLANLRIEAAHKTVADVFSDQYAFSVPAYQRPYAWESQQVEELLADLKDAMAPRSRTEGFYFLGSIVLVKQHGSPEARVVDGQQRLTTLTMLFSAIRDLTDDVQTRMKRERFIKQAADSDLGLKEKLRLQLRRKDQGFFEKHVQTCNATLSLPALDGLSGSKARIVENATLIRERLIEMGEAGRSELVRFLLQNCYLVVVEVPTDTAARRIFTVLNARGLDLTATDILKADLLERAGEDKEEAISERWEDIENALGRDRFSDLFVHVRMIFEREKPRAALETGFPEQVPIFREKPDAFISEILEPFSDAFILSTNDADLRKLYGPKTADLVRSLNRLDNKDWLPPLLLCLRQSAEGRREDVQEIVFKLERLSYYLFLIRADVNARMARYADVLYMLEPSGTKSRDRSEGLDLSEAEARHFFSALDGPIYLASRVVKPLLLRLEQASTDGSATYDYPTITVEHVCPQTVSGGSQWHHWFPDQEEHSELVHKLGNLVLLTHRKNGAAKNYDFDKKKNTYFAPDDTCAFVLTAEVRNAPSWTPTDLRARQRTVLERLAKSWRLTEYFQAWQQVALS